MLLLVFRLGTHFHKDFIMITFTAGLIGLLGLVLAGGGAYLAYLGGSLYFLIAGAAFLLAAIWIARRQSRGLWLFALALVGTYLWALWESGYSWWPLASRVGLTSLLGLWTQVRHEVVAAVALAHQHLRSTPVKQILY